MMEEEDGKEKVIQDGRKKKKMAKRRAYRMYMYEG